MVSPGLKLIQRKLYSFVSSKWGLPLCIVGILGLVISVFQFGGILLEWSKERYAAQFSFYHDNIAGKSFEKFIAPELPIDIVYTWVNGSDPLLLEGLNHLREKLLEERAKEEEKTKSQMKGKNTTHSTHGDSTHSDSTHSDTKITTNTSTTKSPPPAHPTTCPFKHCVPWRVMILDARNLSSLLTLADCRRMFPRKLNLLLNMELFYFNSSKNNYITPAYGLRAESEKQVTRLLSQGVLTADKGTNISVTRGFLTSDGSLLSAVPLPSFYLLLSPHLSPNETVLISLLRKKLNYLTKSNIEEFTVVSDGVGVVRLKSGNWTTNTTLHYHNLTMSITAAHAIWMPFKLPNESNAIGRGDVLAANRFQDNEELRYSLRAVEKFAPWVRHIYIITNGQIPHWLDLDNPRISIVTHEDIFLNKSHLPSYSSPAIESHLHRIPGLSKWFLYLNDDVMFGQDVWPYDFFTPDGGQKVYLSWSVPNCADGCPPNWIHDKYCDTACNKSACDWDGGDCANATHPGPVGGYSWSNSRSNLDYCNTGCLPTWTGDRYCDSSCNCPVCGYDAGDCGVDKFHELYHITITNRTTVNTTFIMPLEMEAMFFNLSSVFPNGSVFTSADHTPSPVIRSAVISKVHKTLSLTFSNNKTASSAYFKIRGKFSNKTIIVQFWVKADTATKNTSLAALNKFSVDGWSFTTYNDSSDSKFLHEVARTLQNSDKTLNYWVRERSLPSLSPPILSPSLLNYTVGNLSVLPQSVAKEYTRLRNEFKEGEYTTRGYLKRLHILLEKYKDFPNVLSNTVTFNDTAKHSNHTNRKNDFLGSKSNDTSDKRSNYKHSTTPRHVELLHNEVANGNRGGMMRKLLEESLKSRHWLPWERLNLFPDLQSTSRDEKHTYSTPNRRGRRLMDTFGDSLRHVNHLYNKAYGHKPRKVPAHMPHMINKEIMQELQDQYTEEFDHTSSHRLRSSDDMQYAFSYFYYVISETKPVSIGEEFEKLDTDKSGILSVRELRTLLVQLSTLPLSLEDVEKFESMLKKCGRSYKGIVPSVDPMEYETHYDPDLPLVTEDFVKNCSELLKKIKEIYGNVPKYSHEEMGEDHIAFKMLHENSSRILGKLDEVRKDQRKFICLNDNMDHSREESRMAQLLLRDFYESLFPIPSQFELPPNYRNRFLYTKELREWLETRWQLQMVLYFLFVILFFMCFGSLFYGKVVQLKRRTLRFLSSFYQKTRSHRIFTV